MGSKHDEKEKPHALCMPSPLQGHINPMLKLAKILHSKGFLITFVNTEYNHQRLLQSQGPDILCSVPSFRFETIPDGLPPPENNNASQDTPSLLKSMQETGTNPFKRLLAKLNASDSPATCLVADFLMGFTLTATEELGIPRVLFWTSGAASLICYDQYPNLIQKGLMPLRGNILALALKDRLARVRASLVAKKVKCLIDLFCGIQLLTGLRVGSGCHLRGFILYTDPSDLVNGYLDTTIDFIPTMSGIRLKDIPPFVRIIHPGDEFMVGFSHTEISRSKKASSIIFNTFEELDFDILDHLSSTFPPCYGIGPLNLLENEFGDKSLASIKSSLWKEESECLKWLDSKPPLSVIYVNFGSITVMTRQQLIEFCWGLAKSHCSFLWIIRPDLVIDGSAALPPEFLAETRDRGMLASWCLQEEVLSHPSTGGFLTHCGWNSAIESISNGVPMICWPFFADQQPNCWCSCNKWSIAIEIDNDVMSDEVAKLVIELMNGEKGKKMRKNVIDLKNKAKKSCASPSGSSMVNLEKVIHLLKTPLK
ncbi:hypothetical protein OSB04_001089 [Centaurea solstitialis]|uniref:Glycosyltransferase n=1 Tax=Centaurea solstitialis TaxID=347529 RepID=A0AA38TQC6_9ASTR|nr:hypothetical protein OSB04_001089 [Centaurea solstitialis]